MLQEIRLFAASQPGAEARTLKDTRSVCPVCRQEVPAAYTATADGAAQFRRTCPTHGPLVTDLGPHAAFYARMFELDARMQQRYAYKQARAPLRTEPFVMRDRANLVMLEVTEKCNLTCPMCFAGSSPAGRHYSLEELTGRMREAIALEGKGVSVQISGGEPTVRKDLGQIVRMCYDAGVGHVEVISNGIRIAKHPEYAKEMKSWGVTSLYLQFDSTDDDDIEVLRGERLWWVREAALEALADADMPVVLAVPLYPGLNDDQVGPVMDVIARSRANIVAVNFQSATPFGGRFDLEAPRKLRLPDILQLFQEQIGLDPAGFFPVGSGSPLCNGYGRVVFKEGRWQHAMPNLSTDDFLDLSGHDPVDFVRALTMGLTEAVPYMTKQVLRHPRLLMKILPLVGNDPLSWLRSKRDKQTTIYIKPFMDESDIDMDRIERCCYHNATPRGIMSFCALNTLVRSDTPVDAAAFEGQSGRIAAHE